MEKKTGETGWDAGSRLTGERELERDKVRRERCRGSWRESHEAGVNVPIRKALNLELAAKECCKLIDDAVIAFVVVILIFLQRPSHTK